MRKYVAIASMFLGAACNQQQAQDPYAPPTTISVSPPEWAEELEIDVRKTSCRIKIDAGNTVNVALTGTDIGNGLTAARDKNDCYVQDAQGLKCNWNTLEKIDWCRMPNPTYHTYLNMRHSTAQMNFRN